MTRLQSREKPDATQEFLRCQLGESEGKTVKTSAFREINVPVFRLVAYGSSWESAVAMWERKEKLKQVPL